MTNLTRPVRILTVHKNLKVDLLIQSVIMLKISWDVVFESNCFDGLEQFEINDFDLVIIQNELRDMSGLEMVQERLCLHTEKYVKGIGRMVCIRKRQNN
jgi:DNA-binding response OmpR family regulator